MKRFSNAGLAAIFWSCIGVAVILMIASGPAAAAQTSISQSTNNLKLQGTITDSSGFTQSEVTVRLEAQDGRVTQQTKSNATGGFSFSGLQSGKYLLRADKSELHSRAVEVAVSSRDEQTPIKLVLEKVAASSSDSNTSPGASTQAMEFSDQPNFSIAGVTDWTAVGGHGSDSILRTSEALARDTLALRPGDRVQTEGGIADGSAKANAEESQLRESLAAAPASLDANRRLGEFCLRAGKYGESIPLLQTASQLDPANHHVGYELALAYKESGNFSQAWDLAQKLLASEHDADTDRLVAQVAEKVGDSLTAVHEFEQAARLDPSEQNYFEWGSELLLHRAVWQAQEVFEKGAKAYPQSGRMLTGKGAALFAGALYDKAAQSLCEASDLDKKDSEPYLFMGKVEMAAPKPLPCIEQKLARFVQEQPSNALANYLYAMAIWKRQGQLAELSDRQQVISLLTTAVKVDPKCSDAYLQLGVLYSSQRDQDAAIGFYQKAIEANPQLGEAHYRLGMAYDRKGESAKAKLEFQQHDEIEKLQAAAIEEERREVKQFLVVGPAKDQVSR